MVAHHTPMYVQAPLTSLPTIPWVPAHTQMGCMYKSRGFSGFLHWQLREATPDEAEVSLVKLTE